MKFKGGIISKSYLLLITVSVLSKILGFFREVVIAQKFGVSSDLDQFLIALTLPTIMYGVLLYAIPNYIVPKYSSGENDNKLSVFSQEFFWKYVFTVLTISIVYYVMAPFIIKLMMGQQNDGIQQAIKLTRILSVYAFFTSVFCAIKGIYHLKNWFVVPAAAPLVIHIILILSVYMFGDKYGVRVLAIAMTLGSVIQLLIVLISSKRNKILDVLKYKGFRSSNLDRTVFVIILIEFLGQAFVFVDRSLTNYLPQGYISGLNYASILNMLPISILGLTLGAVLLPDFSKFVKMNDINGLKTSFFNGIKLVLITGIVFTLVYILGAKFIISVILQRGAFDASATEITSGFLKLLSVGIPFIMMHVIISKLLLSLNKISMLLLVSVIALFFKWMFSYLFVHNEWYFGIAFATVLTYFISDVIMLALVMPQIIKHKNR